MQKKSVFIFIYVILQISFLSAQSNLKVDSSEIYLFRHTIWEKYSQSKCFDTSLQCELLPIHLVSYEDPINKEDFLNQKFIKRLKFVKWDYYQKKKKKKNAPINKNVLKAVTLIYRKDSMEVIGMNPVPEDFVFCFKNYNISWKEDYQSLLNLAYKNKINILFSFQNLSMQTYFGMDNEGNIFAFKRGLTGSGFKIIPSNEYFEKNWDFFYAKMSYYR
jgi:hypothetical protein